MSFEITGTVKTVLPKQVVSEKLTKQVLVIETKDDKYPQVISLEAVNDRCKMLDNIGVGQDVNIHFNLNGREWTKDGKTSYFNTLSVWKVDVLGNSAPIYAAPADISSKPEDDDLPF